MKKLIVLLLFPIIASGQGIPLRHTYVNGQDLQLWHDWSIWVSGLDSFNLTTIGTSGPATWHDDTLNIPNYSGSSYYASGYLGLSGNYFYLDTSGHKAATQTMLSAYYLASNPSSFISMVNNTWGTIITSNNDIAVDSTLLASKKYRQKAVDSLVAWALGYFITGNQTITLSGDVTGSGATSISTTIKSNVALSGNPTTTTQSTSDNSTRIATTAYVKNQGYSTTSGTVTSVGIAPGIGINVSGSPITGSGIMTVTATGSVTAGTGITVGGSFPVYTVTNASPNQTVNIAASTGTSVSGSYPSYTVAATGSLTAGSGITVAGSFPTYTVTNSSPSSGGTVTSVKVVSNAIAYSITPTTAITSNGIYSIVPTGSSAQHVNGDGSFDNNTYLTGNQTITLSGPVTGSGSTAITTSIASGAITNTMLANNSMTLNGTPAALGASTTIPAAANTLTTTTLNPAIVNVGAIGTGTWTATIGAATMKLGSDATYDLYYGNASHILTRLGLGASGTVLGVIGGVLQYTTPPSAGSALAYGNNGAFQWDSLGYQAGARYVLNSGAGDMNLVSHTYTATPTAATAGSAILYINNQTCIDQLHIIPSVGNETILQNSFAQQRIGWNTLSGNGAVGYYGNWTAAFNQTGSIFYANK